MLKMRRFAHTTARARGIRPKTAVRDGEGLLERIGPDNDPKVAKRVVGIANVVKSLDVKRYNVSRHSGILDRDRNWRM